MRRREFLTLLGGAATAWPLAARAQQPERMRRIGVLMGFAEGDPEGQARIRAFRESLQELGWAEGRNVRVEYRFAAYDADQVRTFSQELMALHPDAIFASTSFVLDIIIREIPTIPIVFAGVAEITELGSMARPGRNVTGFTNFEFSLGGKWLDLLKEIAPFVTRVAIIFNPETAPAFEFFVRSIEATAPTFGLKLIATPVRGTAEIEPAINAFAREPNGGLIVLPDLFFLALANREVVIDLAARQGLPAVYFDRNFVMGGGLMSYGTDLIEPYRRAASYIDRILRGAKPEDLPIQAATKFELLINLKTAKALGLTVSPTLLARADEVIE